MSKTWTCGDCKRVHPKSRRYCGHPFDDYLSLRGGSVESAINRAVEEAVSRVERRRAFEELMRIDAELLEEFGTEEDQQITAWLRIARHLNQEDRP